MAQRCGTCIHENVCDLYDLVQDPTYAVGCGNFLDTADVVPIEEVEALQRRYDLAVAEREANVKALIDANINLDAMRGAANSLKMHYENVKQETAREIFEEIKNIAYIHFDVRGDEESLEIIIDEFAELKKKYTEDSPDGKRTDH